MQPNPKAFTADAIDTAALVIPSPEWLRPSDVTRYFGLKRSYLYELIASHAVRSVCLRKKGRSTGIRLISAESLRAWIEQHAEGGDAE